MRRNYPVARKPARRFGRLVLVLIALGSSVAAAVVAKGWLLYTAKHNRTVITLPSPVKVTKVVVARQPLRYGMPLVADFLAEADWPETAVPAGAFRSIAELIGDPQAARFVLASLEPNEPLLPWKISGSGQRASLAAKLQPSLRAATIRVNEVNGVAGFILPGDRVDVLLTRDGSGGAQKTSGGEEAIVSTQVLLQDVHVLGVDQQVDDRQDKPALAKTVTVEVDMVGAQKLALAASVGSLSLALRRSGSDHVAKARRISVADLFDNAATPEIHGGDKTLASAPANHDDEVVKEVLTAGEFSSRPVKVSVIRALKSAQYDVPSEVEARPF